MGVVHLARKPGGQRVALKVLRPHIVGDDEARARLAREVSSLSRIRSKWVAEIVDADPWGPVPYVATRYVPGYSLHDQVQEDGPIQRRRPDLARQVAGRGHRERARGRRAAPRREAVERADGGPHAHPHRLRPGPRRRRPQAHPHRLAARHPRVPAPRDPARRRRDRRVRRALVGRDGRVRRPRAVAVRLRTVDGDHGPRPPRRPRPHRTARRARPAGGVRARPRPRPATDARPDPAPARPGPRPAHPAARRPAGRARGPVHDAAGARRPGRRAPAGPAGRPDRGPAHPGRPRTARPLGRGPPTPSPPWSPVQEDFWDDHWHDHRRLPPDGWVGPPLPPPAPAPRARPPRAVARRGRRGRGGRRRGVPLPGHRRACCSWCGCCAAAR